MHAPGSSGRALGHFMQKHHTASPLLYSHRMRTDSGHPIRQLRKFMEMCGENGTATHGGMKRFQNGPGDREPVGRGGAAADFVDHDQRPRTSLMEDRRRLG